MHAGSYNFLIKYELFLHFNNFLIIGRLQLLLLSKGERQRKNTFKGNIEINL